MPLAVPLPLQVVQCDLGNRAGAGACVAVVDGGAVVLAGCRVAAGSGSGVLVEGGSFASLTHSTVQDCGGAGVTVRSGGAALMHSRVTACLGPAVRLFATPLLLPAALREDGRWPEAVRALAAEVLELVDAGAEEA